MPTSRPEPEANGATSQPPPVAGPAALVPAPSAPSPEPVAAVIANGNRAVELMVSNWPPPQVASGLLPDTDGTVNVLFGDSGNGDGAVGAGWSLPEPGYLWAIGPRSEMRLPASMGRELLIQLAPFVHADRLVSQRLGIKANGVPVASFTIAEQVVVSVTIPPLLARPGTPVTLLFETPDAARPTDVSGIADDRELSFSFRRLLFRPVGKPQYAPSFTPVPAPRGQAPLPRDELLKRFESLGENCEFGLVQRRCGVEPLGLLRFASAPYPKLRAALRSDFEGLGRPENIDVQMSSNGQEYMVHDRAFGLNYHAWVKVEEQTAEEIHVRETRRLPFLVRKLIEDLGTGEKIFVFHGMDPLTLQHASTLKDDLGRYGPGVLLWVELADEKHPPGSAEWVGPGLLKGYMDRFAPGEDAHDISLGCWVDLCQRAVAAADAADKPAPVTEPALGDGEDPAQTS